MSFYLLEIGCEELPCEFVKSAAQFAESFTELKMQEIGFSCKDIEAAATPRRIFLYLNGLPEGQEDSEEAVQGPPAGIAFNADGTLSEAGLKFAKAKLLDEKTLKKVSTPKGEYLAGVRRIKGESSKTLMALMAKELIEQLPATKTMRWGSGDFRFTRPVKYILSIFDGVLLPLDIPEIPLVSYTRGHRFLANREFPVKDLESYKNALREGFVALSSAERKDVILNQIRQLEKNFLVAVDRDEKLLEITANLTEYPVAIVGAFDKKFLELPTQVLITSMKHHQRYFPMYDGEGNLLNEFIGISNMKTDSPLLIAKGYERVLSARLADAAFFFENDRETPLLKRTEALKRVVYREGLGTIYEKVERFKRLGEKLLRLLGEEEALQDFLTAADISKADLMSEMVYEFPELQGQMGRIYALCQGYKEEVAKAVEEHYLPRFAGDKLPASCIGRMLAVSDKLDTIAGSFAMGSIPTGSLDPYGLRRAAIGIINIVEEAGWKIKIKTLAEEASSPFVKNTEEREQLPQRITDFIMARHRQIALQSGLSGDAYDAALVREDDLSTLRERAEALAAVKSSAEFIVIAGGYKRINNILKKAEFSKAAVQAELFEYEEEKALYALLESVRPRVKAYLSERKWGEAARGLIPFAAPVNAFFEKVMVMDKDEVKRLNRLSLLAELRELWSALGDLALLS